MKLVPYTIIDPAAGYPARILRTGRCQPSVLDLQAQAGELMLPVAADHRRQRISKAGARIAAPEPEPRIGVPAPDPVELVLAILEAKKLPVTEAELEAAKTTVRARSR